MDNTRSYNSPPDELDLENIFNGLVGIVLDNPLQITFSNLIVRGNVCTCFSKQPAMPSVLIDSEIRGVCPECYYYRPKNDLRN